VAKHTENQESCKSVFVSWIHAISFISGFVVVVATISYIYGKENTEIKRDVKDTTEKVRVLDEKYTKIMESNNQKFDTLLILMKQALKK